MTLIIVFSSPIRTNSTGTTMEWVTPVIIVRICPIPSKATIAMIIAADPPSFVRIPNVTNPKLIYYEILI